MRKAILFGASKLGEIAINYLKIEYDIVAFFDNDPKKQGETFYGLPVFSPNAKYLNNDLFIIISSMYDVEIAKQLLDIGLKCFGVFEVTANNHTVTYYDYSHIDDFSIIPNKITLIIENYSGSNTLALLKMNDVGESNKYEIIPIYKNKKGHNYYYDLLTSKIVVHTHDFRYNPLQINIQLWHGIPLKGLSYMSNYLYQDTEVNHLAWSKIDFIISPSGTYNTLLNSCYGIDSGKYKVLGMPRNDLLFNDNSRQKLSNIINISFENKKIIFYMPTFRKTVFGEKNGDFLATINQLPYDSLRELDSFLKANQSVMVMKLHPQESLDFAHLQNIVFLTEDQLVQYDIDLYEVLGCADILITDYSSVYFDFLLLKKPIIFYVPDLEVYERERGFLLEPFDFWAPGAKCMNTESLKAELLNVFKNESYYQKERGVVCSIVHRYKDNKSSQRVWEFIDQLLSVNTESG